MAAQYNPSQKRIKKVYREAIDELLKYLIANLTVENMASTEMIQQTAIVLQIETKIKKLNDDLTRETEKILKETYKNSIIEFLLITGIAASKIEARKVAKELMTNPTNMEIIIKDTCKDLLVATDQMSVRLKRIVRKTVAKRLQLSIAKKHGWQDIAERLYKELTEQGLSKTLVTDGFVGIVDKAGRRWKLGTYVDMVVKTKMQNADADAKRFEGLMTNTDLAWISHHGATDDCSKWELVLVSMNGMTAGFPTYQQVKSSRECFHPNCQHHLNPVRSLELAPLNVLIKTQSQLGIDLSAYIKEK